MASWICTEVEDQLRGPDDDDDSQQCPVKDAYKHGWDYGDPENPQNWSDCQYCSSNLIYISSNSSAGKKARHYVPVSLLCLSVAAGASMVTPGTLEIVEKFGVSETVALLSVSLYILGLALGPVIAAPISETMGRALVYKITMPIYMLFILAAGLSSSFGGLLACRFLAGLAGAPCLAVGAGTVADLFEPHEMVTSGSIFIMTAFLGPCKRFFTTPEERS